MTVSTYARILAVLSALTIAFAAIETHLAKAETTDPVQLSAPGLTAPMSVVAGTTIEGIFYGDPPLTVTARYTDTFEEIDVDTTPPSYEVPTSPDDGGRSVVIRVTDGNGFYTEKTVTITYPPSEIAID